MSPQLHRLSGVSVSLSTFLSLYVYVSVNRCFLSFPSPLVSSLAFSAHPSVQLCVSVSVRPPACLPASHFLFSADWALSTTHRAEPLRKTNISLFLLSLRVSLGASFHKANNVMCYHSKPPHPPPTHHHHLPPLHSYSTFLSSDCILPSSPLQSLLTTTHWNRDDKKKSVHLIRNHTRQDRGVSNKRRFHANADFISLRVYRAFFFFCSLAPNKKTGEFNYLAKSNHN